MVNGNDNFDDFYKDEEEKARRARQERPDGLYGYHQQPQYPGQPQQGFGPMPPSYTQSGGGQPERPGYSPVEQTPTPYYSNMNYGAVHQQRKGKTKQAVMIAVIALLMAAVFFLGMLVQDLVWSGDRKLLSDVEKLIKDYALILDESDDEYAHDLYYQAAKAMLQSIDPYSTLLTPEDMYEYEYGADLAEPSVGLSFTNYRKDYEIAEVQIGSPAYKAGLFTGDVICGAKLHYKNGSAGADREITYKTSVEDFLTYIGKDESGNNNDPNVRALELSIERDGKKLQNSFVLARENYTSATVDYYFSAYNHGYGDGSSAHMMPAAYIERNGLNALAADTGYIRLTTFMTNDNYYLEDGTTLNTKYWGPDIDFREALEKFKTAGKTKLILDLRDNGGGRVDVCVRIAEYLIYDKNNPSASSLTVSVDKYKQGIAGSPVDNQTSNIFFRNYNFNFNTSSGAPIAVLTNGNSASASEELLGAILYYGTGVQVGAKTYGKGIAQALFKNIGPSKTVKGKSCRYGAYMTVYQFYQPDGVFSTHGVGFTPKEGNVVTESSAAQVARAVQLLA